MELYQRNGVVVNTTESRGAREEFVEEDLKCLEGQPRFLFPEPKNNETPCPSRHRQGRAVSVRHKDVRGRRWRGLARCATSSGQFSNSFPSSGVFFLEFFLQKEAVQVTTPPRWEGGVGAGWGG